MMWYKWLFVFVISFFTFTYKVDAALCDDAHIQRLKELAEQVEITYEYIDNRNEIAGSEGEYSFDVYSVSFSLMSDELYITDGINDYFYDSSNNGIVKFSVFSGLNEFTVYSTQCRNIKMKTFSLDLPKFNFYSLYKECKELEEYELEICDPWYQGTVSENVFYNIVSKYLNEKEIDSGDSGYNKIVSFFKKYYLAIIGFIVLGAIIIIIGKVYRKRSVLE